MDATILVQGDLHTNADKTIELAQKKLAKHGAKLVRLAEKLNVSTPKNPELPGIYLSYDHKNVYDVVDIFEALVDKIDDVNTRLTKGGPK